MGSRVLRALWALGLVSAWEMGWAESTAPGKTVELVYLSKDYGSPARSYLSEPVDAAYGLRGAEFGVAELNANSRFMDVRYELIRISVPIDKDLRQAARQALANGQRLIVADLTAPDLLAVADLPEAQNAVILDARTSADSLRQRDCRANVFHLLPNWAMRTDALAGYLARKNWRRWFLLVGAGPEDQGYADAVKRAASRSGARIVQEKHYLQAGAETPGAGLREQIQDQAAQMTRASAAYDVLFVADVQNTFGDYLLYNTADPRPVVGTQGLIAVAWDPLFKDYGARGVQYRFFLSASRAMTERDYGNWLAISALGEAVTRSGGADASGIKSYLLSDQFSIGAHKGEGLTFRRWDQQLRQPLLLFGPRILVAMAPRNDVGRTTLQTDVLGFDAAETTCRINH